MRRPSLNPFYAFTVLVIALGSIPKGYDEGGFASASGLASFLTDFGLNKGRWTGDPSQSAVRRAVVSSLGVLGAAIGAGMAIYVTDAIGRLRTWQIFTLVWMTGFFTVAFASGNVGVLLFARIWGGIGAGGLTVVAPLYLSEIAKARTRGMIVSVYMVVLLTSLMLGFFIGYAVRKTMESNREQYRVVLAVPQIPVGIALLCSLFLHDTPRWLLSKNRDDEALTVLARLRNKSTEDAEVQSEYGEMRQEVVSKNLVLAGTSTWTIIKEVATMPTYRSRFLLGLAMQAFAQWSGGNGITYYIPEIFRLAGITSNRALINAGGYGATKLVFTMVFTWGLIDYFGRRRCFMTGLTMQCASHVYMAVYMAIWRHGNNRIASEAAIASVFIYAIGWSIGLCTVQYLYGTEILPTRVRGVCYSVNMMVHWFFQFAVVRTTPAMFGNLDVWGAYVFWALVCLIGLVVLGLWAPETKGVPLERMEELFEGPWYKTWKAKVDVDTSNRGESLPMQTIRDPVVTGMGIAARH
ncbi:Sugar/inositol transporter [Metarhizium album ARSEF 1941]|uniref:Sugar/inositol transporter n=1 Tax=Metarhizium album (strain ARSEF 1941) TaxID=1081103 RepID=A0A0B2WDM7_METAS|nr:Sugar/inositol transporter [Metarhizium album ARSEF 1941]KHN93976.1 Sugar/inositol transporter [Metarhizium album ARSEF 1941]